MRWPEAGYTERKLVGQASPILSHSNTFESFVGSVNLCVTPLMKRSFLIGAICAVLVALSIAYGIEHAGDGRNVRTLSAELSQLNEWNPRSDVIDAINKNDLRFIGCMGFGLIFPGLSHEESNALKENDNYVVLDGTTDAMESNYHRKLIDRAWEYAETYNTEMKNHIEIANHGVNAKSMDE